MRIEGEDVIGACLVVDDHPVHIELFRRTEPWQAQGSGQVGAEPPEPATTEGPDPEAGGRRQGWLRTLFKRMRRPEGDAP